jgi:hypothetical protein
MSRISGFRIMSDLVRPLLSTQWRHGPHLCILSCPAHELSARLAHVAKRVMAW